MELHSEKTTLLFSKGVSLRGPFVFGFIDLFSGSGESWNLSVGMDHVHEKVPSLPSNAREGSKSKLDVFGKKIGETTKPLVVQDKKQRTVSKPTPNVDTIEEDNQVSDKSINNTGSSDELMYQGSNNFSEEEVKYSFLAFLLW